MPVGSITPIDALRPTRLAVVVAFLNEAAYLPRLLASVERQTVLPDQLVLVDDGSSDGSVELATAFAEGRDYVSVLTRPRQPKVDDRLADAAELRAFAAGVEVLADDWDVVVKMDADLELAPDLFEAVMGAFAAEPQLGIAGSFLSIVGPHGRPEREPHPAHHVRGPNKFYRRACYEAIFPLPTILGWDTIDDLRARRHGWITRSVDVPSGDTLHLRPTGAHDGRLKAFRRWGRCAWGYGAHPAWVLVGGMRRAGRRPYVFAGVHYLAGWCNAGLRRYPRADEDTLEQARREGREQLLSILPGRRASSKT